MFYLRKLRAFKVSTSILQRFYQAAVESVVTYNCLCFYGNLREADKNRLKKVTKTAAGIVGGPVKDLGAINEQRTVKRARRILRDTQHPMHSVLADQRSERGAPEDYGAFGPGRIGSDSPLCPQPSAFLTRTVNGCLIAVYASD